MEPVHQPIKAKDVNNYTTHSNTVKREENTVKCDIINLESLRKLIGLSSAKYNQLDKNDIKKWQPILMELLHLLCINEEIGNETVLLASHAYLSLQKALCTLCEFESNLKIYFNLKTNQIVEFNKIHKVHNIELFKLIICNGFLQLGDLNCSHEIYKIIFKIVYSQCIRYSAYTYFAFKILQSWMQRTSKIGFWSENVLDLEEKLEAIIFSNWDNTICKANVIGLFATYLDIMKKKYNDFIPYLFYSCVERISWCHVTKYIILSEICDALDNIEMLTETKFISNLFNSLTINHLCSASTKVYTSICKKLSKDLWQTTFGEHLKNYVITWEAEKKYSALQVLCKCWIEPIIKIYRDILPFLLECCDEDSILYQSHLMQIAKKYGMSFPLKDNNNHIFLNHEDEFVRLNSFAAHCYEVGNLSNIQYLNSVIAIKHFLFFNATADTANLREGIFNYFKIFLSNMLKRASVQNDSKDIIVFFDWLYEFLIDCFEIGSCYQRKIFGLHLYKISLQFLHSNNCTDTILSKDPNFKEAMKYGPLLQKEMEVNGKWKFTDKQTIVVLLKLVLDTANDIKEISTSIIIDYFDINIITDSEKVDLFIIALNKCNSYKFFETDSGAYLFQILTKCFPLNDINKISLSLEVNKTQFSLDQFESYVRFLFEEAKRQLILVKKDILKAVTQNTPFYGITMALLMIGFSNGLESHIVTKEFLEEILNMAENAVNYFLNAFSLKSSNSEHSSSFEEMGLAINQAIKNSELDYEFDELVLSPAQQTIITCIWRSLKVLCELALEIAKSEQATNSIIHRAGELIVTISLKCRHKGVIESAGLAIADLTRYLSRNKKHVELLEGYLKKLLNENFTTNINLTRRGAGLTIIFHKIVASDVRNDRPLLHFALNSLLHFLRNSATMKIEQREASSNYDDPCAMYLHFLKTLVADKQLQVQLSSYLEEICLTCFEYIPSKIFTTRNASFQLFGAIVSRLVGQNTGAKIVDFGYGFSINYFATHFPQLAAHVLLSLQACCQPLDDQNNKRQDDTSIIHILCLLSKMFFSGCELIDGTSITYIKQIRNFLHLFLSSPVAYVRMLAAKCYVATVGLSSIEGEICQLKTQIATTNDFNRLNGYLYTLEYLFEKQDDEIRSTMVKHSKMKSLSEVRKNLEMRSKIENLWNFWSRRSTLIKRKHLCYAIEAQLLRLSRKFKVVLIENYTIESKKKNNFDVLFENTEPGFFEFVDELMILFVNYISYNEDCIMIKTILGAKCIDFGINYLKHAPRNNRSLLITSVDYAINNFERTHQILLEEINIFANESIRNIFRGKLIQLQYVDISKLKTFASKMEGSFVRTIQLSELLTFIHVLSLRGSGTYDLFEDVISCISKEKITLANYFRYPEILRQLIAKGLEILLYNFDHLSSKCRVIPLLASLVLMKDEVPFIRETIRDSVINNVVLASNLSHGRIMDEILYNTLIFNLVSEKTLLGPLDNNQVIEFFEKYLSTVENHSDSFDIENPFDNNEVTFYREESKIINFIVFCIHQKVFKGVFIKGNEIYENISCNIFDTKRDLMNKMNIDMNDLQTILNIKYNDYLAQKIKIVHEEFFRKS